MSTLATHPQRTKRVTREEGLAIAAGRKAARRRRTGRIRKGVAVLAVAAFLTPFGVIYGEMAAGKDPALAATQSVATTSASTDTTSSGSSTTTSTPSPAPVTTQQS